ncbi:Cyclase family protein [Entamoeba marina]
MYKFVDLSSTIETSPESVSELFRTDVDYSDHATGAVQAQSIMGVPASVFRNEEGWATEKIHLGTHNSTHVDAPWHYNSTIQGEESKTIDELPTKWFFGKAIKLDMRWKSEDSPVTVADVKKELKRIRHVIKPYDIVFVQTGMDQYYSDSNYIYRGCGVTAEATTWLYNKGVRLVGIDAWGWDQHLDLEAERAIAAGNVGGIFWAAHQCDLQYCHIERLMNLDQLPDKFLVSCFPLKIKDGSAGPARVVAMVNKFKNPDCSSSSDDE